MKRFQAWLRDGKPLSHYTYASGLTWLDERKPNNSKINLIDAETREVADAAWKAYEQGKVELCQRRNPNGKGFDYVAQRRRTSHRLLRRRLYFVEIVAETDLGCPYDK